MDTENGLPLGWTARLGLNGRIYYHSKRSQIVQILPPPDIWKCKYALPYGWEMAVDYDNKSYYINHITQTVTYEDPRTEDDQSTPTEQQNSLPPPDILPSPQPREYLIERDPRLGFGFIAGSEKPTVVRSVTPGGPSDGKLLADDQILKIGKENVLHADRERIIQLIKSETNRVSLTVLQPNRSANSSFLNPVKKTFRTMDRPKVRFADDVVVNGQERAEGSSLLLAAPGVLRVQMETKETKSIPFDSGTTAGDMVSILCDEMGFKNANLFSLIIAPPMEIDDTLGSDKTSKSSSSNASEYSGTCSSSPDAILIAPWDTLSKVFSNPAVRHHYCYLRMEFMPKDFHALARDDPEAFSYLYIQCVNDVVTGDLYRKDLCDEDFVKLAVYQMLGLVLDSMMCNTQPKFQKRSSSSSSDSSSDKSAFRFSGLTNKITLKYFEKEYGLRRFLPPSLMREMRKDNPTARNIRKSIQQNLKTSYTTFFINQNPATPSISNSQTLLSGGSASVALQQLRVHYLKILSPRHLFGGRFFYASMQGLMESDVPILVGHNYGISQMINTKTRMASILVEFQSVSGIEVVSRQPESRRTTVKITFDNKDVQLTMEVQDAYNFAIMAAGYCRVYNNTKMVLTLPIPESVSAPTYFGPHKVKPSFWNYPPDTENSGNYDDFPPPPFFYCDFSEPVTPALLSQETPPLAINLQKNGHNRSPTPPPVHELDETDSPVFIETPIKNGDANNNASPQSENLFSKDGSVLPNSVDPVVLEEVNTAASSANPAGSTDMATYNGYLVPTPPCQRANTDVNGVKRNGSDGEGAWNDFMTILAREAKEVKTGSKTVHDEPSEPSSKPKKVFLRQQSNERIIVPSPPNYPPPKRNESLKKEKRESWKEESNVRSSSELLFMPDKSPQFSSFKPNEGELKVFAHSPTEITLSSKPSSPINHSSQPNRLLSTSLEDFKDVKDAATRQKLRETEDLIEYFRKKRQEMAVTSKDNGIYNSITEIPMVVEDLAAGNKRLRKAEKASIKNRKSWAGSETLQKMEDPGTLSISNPDLTSSPVHKKRNQSLFRKLFSSRRKKPVTMYNSAGLQSSFGKRKKRFRFPRLRLRKAFSLHSKRKSGSKSVLPTSEPDTRSKSRFKFSSKKRKSHGVLVISEPCDDFRGVDLLPSGKYTVAGSMFSGNAKETEVITLESVNNSTESLSQIGLDAQNSSQNTMKSVEANAGKPNGNLRESQQLDNHPSVQHAVVENHTEPNFSNNLPSTEEERRRSLSYTGGQASPCELSQTESTEALQDVSPSHTGTESMKDSVGAVQAVDPVETKETLLGSIAIASDSHSLTDNVVVTPKVVSHAVKKRPSQKRRAPLPPAMPPYDISEAAGFTNDSEKIELGPVSSEIRPTTVHEEKYDSGDENKMDPKNDDSPSLVTEIFSYLKNNSLDNDLPDLANDEFGPSEDTDDALPYDESYEMPGIKSTAAVMDVRRMEKENASDNETRASQQRAMYEMLYNDMLEDDSRLTLGDTESCRNESSEEESAASSSDDDDDDGRHGSYDVTMSEASDDSNDEADGVVLKHFAYQEDATMPAPENVTPSDKNVDSEKSLVSDSVDSTGSSTASSPRSVDDPKTVFSYRSLITPSGYSRGGNGIRRISMPQKPPIPPKPVFH